MQEQLQKQPNLKHTKLSYICHLDNKRYSSYNPVNDPLCKLVFTGYHFNN